MNYSLFILSCLKSDIKWKKKKKNDFKLVMKYSEEIFMLKYRHWKSNIVTLFLKELKTKLIKCMTGWAIFNKLSKNICS